MREDAQKPRERNLWQHPESGIWYVRKQIGGERKCISTGEATAIDAPPTKRVLERRDTIIGRLKDDRWDEGKKTTPTVEEWWQEFQEGELAGKAKGTQRAYNQAIGALQPVFMAMQIGRVTKMACQRQIRWLEKSRYAESTIFVYRATVQRLFEAAKEDKLIKENPWAGIELEKPEGKVRVLSEEEKTALLAMMRPYDQRWFKVLLLTGVRIAELRWLHPACIKWGEELLGVLGKGSKHREVPMDEDVVPLLKAQIRERRIDLKPQAKLWSETVQKFEGILQRYSRKLGIPPVTPHTCRHTYATEFIERGGSVYMLSKFLGHANVKTTEKLYVHERKASLVAEWKRVRNTGNNLATGTENGQIAG